jgi:hypothetical protein
MIEERKRRKRERSASVPKVTFEPRAILRLQKGARGRAAYRIRRSRRGPALGDTEAAEVEQGVVERGECRENVGAKSSESKQ